MSLLTPFSAILNVIVGLWKLITFKQSFSHVLWEVILHLTRNTSPRVRSYPATDSGNLEDNGIRVPLSQRELENRRQLKPNESDSILIYGCNSLSQRLVVRVSICGQVALSSLFLRLTNGKTYTLPKTRLINVPRTSTDSFVGNGLRIRCVVPMRKWRVSYAGLLKQTSNNGETELVNVKFGLFWSCSSLIHDLKSDISNSKLAEVFATQNGYQLWKNKMALLPNMDSYVQAGNMIGSVSIDGQEERLALWGARKRSVEFINSKNNDTEVLSYTKDGQMFHFGSMKISSLPKKLEYGFVVLRSSICHRLDKVTIFTKEDERIKKAFLSTGQYDFCVKFDEVIDEVEWPVGDLLNTNQTVNVTFNSVTLEDDVGEALVLQNNRNNSENDHLSSPKSSLLPLCQEFPLDKPSNEVLTLMDVACHYPGLTGGKGSSLASLHGLRRQIQPTYEVPSAIVVTTLAYETFYKKNKLNSLIRTLEDIVWWKQSTNKDIEDICNKISSEIDLMILPASIQDEIKRKMVHVHGSTFNNKRFAVRSSASGEDSEEMSAAGQMKTFLGLNGIEKISEAVVQCWSSQFSFTAVQYKKQNGQLLNTPMAVVIQEMVAADAAGVLFTCDPVTGNADKVTMTCNYGIGESVVSASADPDTIVFQRDADNKLDHHFLSVGGKSSMTIMSDDSGVKDSIVDEQSKNKCSISIQNAETLAQIAVNIEEAYGCPIDLEWAIKNEQVYILQARPITTLDKESELELMHEIDHALRCEDEFLTRANAGEVVSKPFSYICASSFIKFETAMIANYYRDISRWVFVAEEFLPTWCSLVNNNVFLSMPMFNLRFHQNGERSLATEASMVSGFGKILDDQEMLNQAHRRNKFYPDINEYKMTWFSFKNLILLKWRIGKCRKYLQNKRYNFDGCQTAYEMYVKSMEELFGYKEPSVRHADSSILSSLVNTMVMTVLVSGAGGEWGNSIYNDFASILSHCAEEVESATVPAAIEDLSRTIAKTIDVNDFKQMTKEAALCWLKSTKSKAGDKYKKFIETHGHRGINESDVYRKTWEMDEIPLIETLQAMVGSNLQEKIKKDMNTSDTIKALSVPLKFLPKLYLKILIPVCRRLVACREMTKSTYMYAINQFRHACWKVAAKMVQEGRLPDEELFFFLTHYEHLELLETRNAKLVQKAIRRREFFPKMTEFEYDLITKGYPLPVNRKEEENEPVEASFTLKGTPVSQGYIKGTARVAIDLQEAKHIKKGEILIGKGTDIGWSPYFPMLAGVVTELGGLVSHGAVVAREYGLPCVVGVEGATRKLRSGDLIVLDANKGIITKLHTVDKCNKEYN